MKDNNKKSGKLAPLWQFVKFGLVGAVNTVLNYLIYNFCYHVLHTGVPVATHYQLNERRYRANPLSLLYTNMKNDRRRKISGRLFCS